MVYGIHFRACRGGASVAVSRRRARCAPQTGRRRQCHFLVTARCAPRAMRFSCHGKMCAAGSAIFVSRQNVRCGRAATYRRPVGLCGVPAAERLHSKCLPSQSSSFRHFEPLRGPYYPSRSPCHYENSPKSYKTLVTSQFIAAFMEIKTVSTKKYLEKAINLYKVPNL